MARHIGGDSQRPDAGSRAPTLLRFETVMKTRMVFGFRGEINLAPGPVVGGAFGKLPVYRFCGLDADFLRQYLLDFVGVQKQRHRFKPRGFFIMCTLYWRFPSRWSNSNA